MFLQLKQPQTEQLGEIVALDHACLGGIWTLEGYQRELANPTSELVILSALSSQHREKIIGCGCFWAILEEAHITLLMIHPDFQGQGLGQLLLYSLLKTAASRQLERATLEVKASNQAAQSLYAKFGFKLAGKRKSYYQTTGEDALILWRGELHHPEFSRTLADWESSISDRLSEKLWRLTPPSIPPLTSERDD
jgi:ribosomal-protein-alanine N-acetyltransferase